MRQFFTKKNIVLRSDVSGYMCPTECTGSCSRTCGSGCADSCDTSCYLLCYGCRETCTGQLFWPA